MLEVLFFILVGILARVLFQYMDDFAPTGYTYQDVSLTLE
jgi:hypothetical protein